MTNSKKAKPQPCFVPFVTSKSGDTSLFSMTLAHMPSWRKRMMETKSVGQTILSRISQRVVLSVHRIECLREISKDSIHLALLLPTLLLQLSGSKYHIHGAAA